MEVRVSSSGGQTALDGILSLLLERMPRLQQVELVGNVPNIGRLPAGVYHTGSIEPGAKGLELIVYVPAGIPHVLFTSQKTI